MINGALVLNLLLLLQLQHLYIFEEKEKIYTWNHFQTNSFLFKLLYLLYFVYLSWQH